ncbi:hypothetical protein GCM10022246_19230 [Pedobacter ginsengiterrae]|uniref:Uncharacterized protein n=1 Tax=Pedobacter ginsengiterrae TaxID=871696 RepID=A0ABP7PJG7_9SPHI
MPNNSVEGTKTIYAIVIFQNLDLSLDKKKTAKTRQIDSIVEFVENKLIIPSPFILIIGNYSSFTNYIYINILLMSQSFGHKSPLFSGSVGSGVVPPYFFNESL